VIAVRVGSANQALELALLFEMKRIVGRDVELSALDMHVKRATRLRRRDFRHPAPSLPYSRD
jgi:hypothetical protein